MADADEVRIRRKRPRKAKEDVPETPDAIDIAMHALATGGDQSGIARAVLEKHAKLIDIQCKREREELENVRVQRIIRWLMIGAVAALMILIGFAVYEAVATEALVVEPFRVPPALEQSGLGGEVMATRVMDRIATMQAQTLSTRPASTYSTNWGDDIKVAVPDTGATIGDIRNLLRSWFGNETRISGEVVHEDNGWTVTGRVSGHTAITAKGAALEPLVQQVAEGIFHQTQPYRYVVYLNTLGRSAEAIAAARELAMNGPEQERPWGLVALANSLGPPNYGDVEKLPAMRDAAAAVPDFPMPSQNLGATLENLGRWEEALPVERHAVALVGNGSSISEQFRGQVVAAGDARPQLLLGAYGDAAPRLETASHQGTPVYGSQYASAAAVSRYFQHDVRAGDRDLNRLAQMLGFTNLVGKPITSFLATDSSAAWAEAAAEARIIRADELGDGPALRLALGESVPWLARFLAALPPKVARDEARTVWPIVASGMVDGGMANEAAALLQGLPEDCYPCVVARGQAAAALGQRVAAEKWFALAKRIGPSFPFADDARGRMLLNARDIVGAQASFQQAIAIEPRFPNAHEGSGEAYAAIHDWKDAARAYGEAAQLAPQWGKLHIRWAAALWNSGRSDDARAKLSVASGMELSAADRQLLSRLQAIAAR